MMNIDRFIIQLSQVGIQLRPEGNQLRLQAESPEAVTDDLLQQIRTHKAALIAYLNGEDAQSAILPRPMNGPPPLSFAQQRLWFLDQLELDSTFYNMPAIIKLTGQLDVNALEQSFRYLIARHESLRTVFGTMTSKNGSEDSRDGEPIQVIHAPSSAAAQFTLTVRSAANQEEAQQLADMEALTPFNLYEGPLLRVQLLQIANDDTSVGSERCHLLLINTHHIISDGWSMGVMVDELTHAYRAFVEGVVPTLPDLPIQYADFAIWQRDHLSGERLETQLVYWREQLADSPELLELPTDRPRPPVQSHQGARFDFQLDADLAAKLHQLAQRHDATLFMVLLAAFNVLLARYSRQENIVVGTNIANRTRAEVEGLIGFFANTLVLRTRLEENPSFAELLAQVRQTTLGAYQHQDLPFEQLVYELDPERTLSYSPLFQVMLVLQNAEMGEFALPNLTATMQLTDFPFAKFDLTLNLMEDDTGEDTGMLGMFAYATDLFDETTIARMAGHFTVLLKGVVAQPDQPVLQLPMLTATEYHQIVHEWNDTAADYDEPLTIHELFEQQAKRTPDAIAVIFRDEKLTYRELNERANRLAHYLIEQGVGPEVLVGICVERSFEMVVGVMGILKAGGAYVPLEASYPEERLAFLLQDSQIKLLLTQTHLIERFDNQLDILCLDKIQEIIEGKSQQNPTSRATPDNLAYVIYTSGSTGQPKGAMILHQGISHSLLWRQRTFQLDTSDRVLQKAAFSFDVSVWELCWPLLAGASVVLAEPERGQDCHHLAELIIEHAVTFIQFVPSVLKYFLAEPRVGECTSLRRVWSAGEALTYTLQNEFFDCLSADLFNGYGPTETSTAMMYEVCHPEEGEGVVSIGRPFTNTQLYILDSHLNPVPVGVPGELHIGGISLGRGYYGRPELTAERWIRNPFFPNSTIYKTGDLVCYLPDGRISFLGRIDHQVKINGVRVELGEIESVILSHATIDDVVVIVREDKLTNSRLIAYIVGKDNTDIDMEGLQQYLAHRLPNHMVPTAFVQLPAMPLTPNGKLDRDALPAPESINVQGEFVAPRTEMEKQVAAIWSDLLRIDQVGVYDNFFALGGHSLLATQIISRVRAELNLDIPLKVLFEASELGNFAHAISQAQASADTSIQPHPRGTRHERPLPLSFAQQRLWFLDQLEPESAFYNLSMVMRLTGQLDVDALEQSFKFLIVRHESLRTVFRTETREGGSEDYSDGEPIQIVHAPSTAAAQFALTVRPVVSEEEAQQRAQVEVTTPFNLSEGPLLRVQLFQIEDNDHLLVLNVHHIISDGWSQGVLMQELTHAYRAYTQGNQPTLPIQYADFAVWQRNYLSDGPTNSILESQLTYWREQLAGVPALLELPTDYPRPPIQSYRGAHYVFELDADLTAKLNQLAQRHDATLFMVLLAAFNVLLARYSRQEDIVVGSPIANRNRAEIEGLIGFFVNTLALRTHLEKNPSFTELLAQVCQTTLDAYAHQDLPFEQLVDKLDLEHTLSYSPLFQVVLNLQNAVVDGFTLPGLTAIRQPVDNPFAKFDLTLHLTEIDDGLFGVFEYATDLFDEATIVRMASHFTVLLEGIVSQPDHAVFQLPMLTAAERHQIVHKWNDTAQEIGRDFGAPQTIHTLFEQQVACTPDAVALLFDKATSSDLTPSPYQPITLSYAELNARANQLAHHLIELGVQADTLVAVAMERSVEMVVSLLAVLKAGGAYVPIDPTYPADRIAFILQDCGTELLLTEAHLIDDLQAYDGQSILVSNDRLDTYPQTNPSTTTTPNHLAYVIYTSGSTGQPKGTLIPHQNVWRLFAATDAWFRFKETDVWTLFHSYAFDFSVWELWGALFYGGRLVIVPYHVSRDPQAFYQLLCHQGVTVLNQTPSAFRQLISVVEQSEQIDNLRYVIFGGEALDFESLRPWFALRSDTQPQLVNMYGITETTVHVTYQPIQAADLDLYHGSSRIGQAIPDLRLYILDTHGQPAPIGVGGELHVGGAGLARGYLNRPELTTERFIDHSQFGRLYKTGDLCRWFPDGNIEYIRRTDFQVKIRGFRIELGEIENALLAQEGVREAVVLAREDELDDKRLVAYIVADKVTEWQGDKGNNDNIPSPSHPFTLSELRRNLETRLPDYMIPSAFVMLDAVPLTPNGKLDRRALPVPTIARDTSHIDRPRTLLEQQIVNVWEQTLGIYPIGIHDNFFEIGGHSLLAVQLMARLQPILNQQLPLRTLFTHPTVAMMAASVKETLALTTSVVTLQPRGTQPPFYCLPGAGGGVLYLHPLAQAMGNQQPFYALESVGLDGKTEPFTAVQAAAAYHVEQIQQHHTTQGQFDPSYCLAGHSFGGFVVYEMAQQLYLAGGHVGSLIILDSPAPTGKAQPMEEVEIILTFERLFLEELGLDPTLTQEQLIPLATEERLLLFQKSLEDAGYLPPNSSLEQIRGIINVAAADSQATGYLPSDFIALPIHLFVATDAERSEEATQTMIDGWAKYGDVTVHEVPGTHTTMMYTPHVNMLSEKIKACLAG